MRNPQLSYYTGPLYHDLPTYAEPPAQRGRVFLVAVRGEQQQSHARGSFDRVHVMVVDPNQMADLSHPLSVLCALPDVKTSMPSRMPPRGLLAVQSRPVCGEILRNEKGRFYERRGRHLVPLRNLVSGPEGEVIEFLPPAPAHNGNWGDNAEAVEYLETDEDAESVYEEREPRERNQTRGKDCGTANQFIRKLFPDPGQLRLVNFGDFSRSLTSQLKFPERLRETHRLPCYLQVFEVRQPVTLQKMAASLDADPAQLYPLNPRLAQKLGLGSLVPTLRRTPINARPLLVPGDMVCRLQIVRDPTVELESSHAVSSPPNASQQTPAPQPTRPISPGRKTIPECYCKPWEFQLSRDEALYDMNAAHARGWLKRVVSFFSSRVRRKDLERWRTLLTGKSADDQLWAIRPPDSALSNPRVRAWACNTLALAGYDVQTMAGEWEVYWRRKGLS
jgi:hypothetical protein